MDISLLIDQNPITFLERCNKSEIFEQATIFYSERLHSGAGADDQVVVKKGPDFSLCTGEISLRHFAFRKTHDRFFEILHDAIKIKLAGERHENIALGCGASDPDEPGLCSGKGR